MIDWLDWERVDADKPGGSFIDVPWRIVLHTTEGGSVAGAVQAYRNTGSWPHATVDPVNGQRVQHYPLSVSARALENRSGGVETNRARAIQVEIVAYAADSPDWTNDALHWLGEKVIRPLVDAVDGQVQLHAPEFIGSEGYGVNSPSRMSPQAWNDFDGVCAHQHVPENEHWDAGALDIQTVLAAAAGPAPIPEPQPPPEEDDVQSIYFIRHVSADGQTFDDPTMAVYLSTDDLATCVKLGSAEEYTDLHTWYTSASVDGKSVYKLWDVKQDPRDGLSFFPMRHLPVIVD